MEGEHRERDGGTTEREMEGEQRERWRESTERENVNSNSQLQLKLIS
jgi:hypothetical protein